MRLGQNLLVLIFKKSEYKYALSVSCFPGQQERNRTDNKKKYLKIKLPVYRILYTFFFKNKNQ